MRNSWLREQHRSIFLYLKGHWKVCGIGLLAIAEFLVFAILNVEPSGHYERYVAETAVKYGSRFSFIFWENLKSGLGLVCDGTIPFGLGVIWGGYGTIAGLVATFKWLRPEFGGRTLLLCTLPHGLFEIPAICFSLLLSALWSRAVTTAIVRLVRRKPVFKSFREDALSILKSIVFVQLPLILIAAIIESTVSRWLVRVVL